MSRFVHIIPLLQTPGPYADKSGPTDQDNRFYLLLYTFFSNVALLILIEILNFKNERFDPTTPIRRRLRMFTHAKLNFIISILLILVFVAPSPNANSTEIGGVFFEDHVFVGNTLLSKRGAGLFRYLGIIKAYVGALYVEDGKQIQELLNNSAKRLEIEYFLDIKGDDFGPATNKLLARNVDPEILAGLQDRIDKHNALYEDVQPGDRYSLTFIPGKGTELALNGEPKGIIEGDDFASAIYSIWLGKNPISHSFKNQLMGIK
jgi:hypothetical protein